MPSGQDALAPQPRFFVLRVYVLAELKLTITALSLTRQASCCCTSAKWYELIVDFCNKKLSTDYLPLKLIAPCQAAEKLETS
ncbi:MAG: hypothetical protein ABSB14_22150, partial [Candidatus Sulfotelmatobacter sp.]